MEYERWAPFYERIARSFGFAFEREERSARRLRELLSDAAKRDPWARVERRLAGRDAIVAGLAPGVGAPPVWRLDGGGARPSLLAADGATARCLDAGLVPDVIVSDLDGPVPQEIAANARGALVVVHAHGDNLEAIARWVPQFTGEVVGSWAGPPGDGLLDPGGFTDGDRAAYLAEAAGAPRIRLWGFDFEHPDEADAAVRRRKLEKLRVAKESLQLLARTGRSVVQLWAPDGSLAPLDAG